MNYLPNFMLWDWYQNQTSQIQLGDIKKYVTILGDSNTGKTTLLNRLIGDHYSEHSNPTIGLDLMTMTTDTDGENLPLKIIFWDTAGQERYLAIASSYCRNISVILLVFSIDDYQSWRNLLNSWLPLFQKYSNCDTTIIIVGTKLDLERRMVQQSTVLNFMEQQQIPLDNYIETSSKTGENIDKLHDKIVDTLKQGLSPSQSPRNEILSLEQNYTSNCCSK